MEVVVFVVVGEVVVFVVVLVVVVKVVVGFNDVVDVVDPVVEVVGDSVIELVDVIGKVVSKELLVTSHARILNVENIATTSTIIFFINEVLLLDENSYTRIISHLYRKKKRKIGRAHV